MLLNSSSMQNSALPTCSWLGSLLNIEMSDKNNLCVGLSYWAVSMHWDDVGHFYPGDPGIAREVAKSKQELLNQRLGRRLGPGRACGHTAVAAVSGQLFLVI